MRKRRKKTNIKYILVVLYFISLSSVGQEKLSLKDCINIAIEKNISINNSSLDLLNSSENKKIAIGNFLPSLNISGNHNWNSGLTQNITTGILENQTTESSSINMSVALNIFSGLENIRKLHRANLDILAKKYQLADMKEDVSLLVANAYLQILFNQEQLEVQKSQLKISKEELNIAKQKFENGVISQGDLYDIEANYSRGEKNLIVAENNYQLSKISLGQLLMLSDIDNFEIEDNNYEIPKSKIITKTAKEIFNEALKKRNDIKLAETNLEIAIKDHKISKSELLPSASAFYSYNSRVLMGQETSLKSQFDLNTGKSIGVQLNIPVLNGWFSRANIKKGKLNILRSENLLNQVKMDLKNTIYQALNDVKGAKKSFDAAKKAELARKTAYQYAKERFENGALNTINYFQAKQLFETAQSDLITAKYDYIFKIKVLEFYFGITSLEI